MYVGSSSWGCLLPHVHSLSNNNLSLYAVLTLAKEVITCQNATELLVRYQYIYQNMLYVASLGAAF